MPDVDEDGQTACCPWLDSRIDIEGPSFQEGLIRLSRDGRSLSHATELANGTFYGPRY